MYTRILIFTVFAAAAPVQISYAAEGEAKEAPAGTIHVVDDEVYQYDPEKEKKEVRPDPKPKKSSPLGRIKPASRAVSDDEDEDDGVPLGEQFNLELRGLYWSATLDTNIRVDSGELKGTEVDVVDDLGLAKQTGVPNGEITLKFFNRHKLKVNYFRLAYSADTVVEESFVFNGVEYDAASQVNTEIDLSSTRVSYEVDLIRGNAGYFAFRLSGDYINAKASLVTNDVLSNKATLGIVAPLPGIAARISPSRWVSLTADISGIGYNKSYVVDGAAYVDINPTRNVGLVLGYRTIQVNIDLDDKKANAKWSGFFAGIALRI